MLLNTGAVCGQIFMRCWKGRFFRTSWTVLSWGSVISGERDGEAAARSLQRRIGGKRCQCALNTSCFDHGALMSTLWDLFSWQCLLWTNFCFTKTFVTLSLALLLHQGRCFFRLSFCCRVSNEWHHLLPSKPCYFLIAVIASKVSLNPTICVNLIVVHQFKTRQIMYVHFKTKCNKGWNCGLVWTI